MSMTSGWEQLGGPPGMMHAAQACEGRSGLDAQREWWEAHGFVFDDVVRFSSYVGLQLPPGQRPSEVGALFMMGAEWVLELLDARKGNE